MYFSTAPRLETKKTINNISYYELYGRPLPLFCLFPSPILSALSNHTYPSIYLPICLNIFQSICLSTPATYLSIYVSVFLSINLFCLPNVINLNNPIIGPANRAKLRSYSLSFLSVVPHEAAREVSKPKIYTNIYRASRGRKLQKKSELYKKRKKLPVERAQGDPNQRDAEIISLL